MLTSFVWRGAGERLTHYDGRPVTVQVKKIAPKAANIFGGVRGVIPLLILTVGEIHALGPLKNAAVRGMVQGPLCAPLLPFEATVR